MQKLLLKVLYRIHHNVASVTTIAYLHVFIGCDPSIMGIGPVPAIRALLEKTGYQLSDIDLVEVSTQLLVLSLVTKFLYHESVISCLSSYSYIFTQFYVD